MAVTILKGGELPGPKSTKHPEVKPDQIEVFGRLRMSRPQIAEWYGLTRNQIEGLFRRPDIANAYNRGRSEVIVAIRQKQIELALKGNVQLLVHTGIQFAEQDKSGLQDEPEDHNPGRFSWDVEMKDRLQATRDALGISNEAGE